MWQDRVTWGAVQTPLDAGVHRALLTLPRWLGKAAFPGRMEASLSPTAANHPALASTWPAPWARPEQCVPVGQEARARDPEAT